VRLRPWVRAKGFFNEVIVELKKTTWPTPKEAWRLTMVVIGVIVAIAIYMGVIDAVLSWATKKFNLIK
jgi:preprotein translocase subunit SecE